MKISVKLIIKILLIFSLPLLALAGCGTWQSVKDGTVNVTRNVFYSKLKTLKIDLIARHALNQNERGQSLSTVVRIYQLQDKQKFESALYRDLLNQDKTTLGDDLLEDKEVIIRPGEAIAVDSEIHKDMDYVGVVVFFNRTDDEQDWKMLIPKKELSNKKSLPIELVDRKLLKINKKEK
ncbi:type VI secretion system lipoprotein TssJ [Neisseria canis]|uniref:Uncharacterized protein conserved in bacteria n=1 Tax=Neisseria canis TaxID=493 RepID=A0A1X3CSY7_9NEIS|nr:type VI secretion system lipoprotein TssJ [Neisseria canis]OSI10327.1 type VI secretion system-associated lipoprotein [Neisseria canis]VEF00499.1 Uncharacterized protein conserved in bacteria [Neisseria canis]